MTKILNANKIKVIGIAASVMAALLVGACSTSTNPANSSSAADVDGSEMIAKKEVKMPWWASKNAGTDRALKCKKTNLKNGEKTTCSGKVPKYIKVEHIYEPNLGSDKGMERWEFEFELGTPFPISLGGPGGWKFVGPNTLKVGGTSTVTIQATRDNVNVGKIGVYDSPVGLKAKATKCVGAKRLM